MNWQKWVGRGLIALDTIVLAVCAFFQVEIAWWQVVMVGLTAVVQMLLALFPK